MLFWGLDLSPSSSALVRVTPSGGPTPDYWHFFESNTKYSFTPRRSMALRVLKPLMDQSQLAEDHIVGLEDYDLGTRNQYVSYQIAEVAAILKHELLKWGVKLILINPRKRMSYVRMTRKVDKKDIIRYASEHDFRPPKKQVGGPGYYARQIEDLSDAFVLGKMTAELFSNIQEKAGPKRGDIFLDPQTGLAYRSDLLFNLTALTK